MKLAPAQFIQICNIMCIVQDLRYFLILAINMLKFDHVTWDPFKLVSNPTWFSIGLLITLSLFFSFVSVQTSPFLVFRAQPRNFSPVLLISLVTALILPQFVFWYFYPIILLSSTDCAAAIFVSFAQSLQARIPTFTIHITHTNSDDDDDDVEMARAAGAATSQHEDD